MRPVFLKRNAALVVILCLMNCRWSESPTEPERATVRGRVSFGGAPVPGARVNVTISLPLQRFKKYETSANPQGEYEFLRIEPGLCDFSVYCPGSSAVLNGKQNWAIKPGLNELDFPVHSPCG